MQCNKCKSIRQPIQQDVLAKGYGHINGIEYLPYGVYALTCKCGACAVYDQSGVLAVHTYGEHGPRPFRIGTRKELSEEEKAMSNSA